MWLWSHELFPILLCFLTSIINWVYVSWILVLFISIGCWWNFWSYMYCVAGWGFFIACVRSCILQCMYCNRFQRIPGTGGLNCSALVTTDYINYFLFFKIFFIVLSCRRDLLFAWKCFRKVEYKFFNKGLIYYTDIAACLIKQIN